ncbi:MULTISPECIES: septum site-determining protein MinC [unclassified Roseivivax]|uniref:septum site-determining protein MinC n=1 Tax=Roseivivax sp. GX 12232 TaxID=2900547 RepID=UPI001E46E260|nr:septum site-determining protein MinC [Roseivivax sp. GX 12232]MCE0505532.1 septum site-determining protein MinC [Roseivivax sp. GX 12232]
MPAQRAPFQIRGRFLTALALRIDGETTDDGFYAHLDDQLRQTSQFFDGAPMVLDLGHAPGVAAPEALSGLVENLRARKLKVFGVQNAPGCDAGTLDRLGLIEVTTGRDAPLPAAEKPARVRAREERRGTENKVVRQPVRSGQMVVAERGDLTVIGSVASGAELVASGNIHVYGRLRGRAMAGAHGDESARILCQSLEAELVAIAGLYKTSETLEEEAERGRAMHIFLKDERLLMEAIG